MEIFRTKLYQYFPGDEISEKDLIDDVSKTLHDYPNSQDVVFVIDSGQEGYVKDISTGLLLPVFRGDKLVYKDFSVRKMDRYTGSSVEHFSSVPSYILEFQDTSLFDCYAGVPSLQLFSEKASYDDVVRYLDRNENPRSRYRYLHNQIFDNDDMDSFNLDDAKKLRDAIGVDLQKMCHIFSTEENFPFERRKTYSLPPVFLQDNKKLPIELSVTSKEAAGYELFRKLSFHDFDAELSIIRKLYVTLNRKGCLEEIRSKKVIPYVYYQFDSSSKKIRLMVNGRPASKDEHISFFIFLPSTLDKCKTVNRSEIKEYRTYYTNFENVLDSYLETNQVISDSSHLKETPKQEVKKTVSFSQKDTNDQESVSVLTFDGSTFSSYLPQILEVRNMILSTDSNPFVKEQYLSKLNSVLKQYDSDIKKLQDSFLTLQDKSIIQNNLLKGLTDIEAHLSTSDTSDNYQWVSPYLEFLGCDSTNLYDNFKSIYYFSLDFQRKAMDSPATLLHSLKAQQEIDEALFSSLLKLNGIEQASAILLLNDSTVERLATVVDNHIDKVSEADGDIAVVNALKNYNEEKALKSDKDIPFLRDYLKNTIASYSQLDSVKVLGKEGV